LLAPIMTGLALGNGAAEPAEPARKHAEHGSRQAAGSVYRLGPVMNSGTAVNPSMDLLTQTVGGITIAELTGELDIASAPGLREQLLSLLRPGAARLVIDLSKVSFADASGLAVLVSTARRARLLGGFLRLAAVSPPAGQVLRITGLHRTFAIFPTVQAAATGARASQQGSTGAAVSVRPAGGRPRPASGHAEPPTPVPADAGQLREAVAALLSRADAWHSADPGRRFTPALGAMARASNGTDDTALQTASRSLLSALSRHPLTHSPAVAATATRLRRLLNPASGRAST
jgi:anti-sigma B factor antagonist